MENKYPTCIEYALVIAFIAAATLGILIGKAWDWLVRTVEGPEL